MAQKAAQEGKIVFNCPCGAEVSIKPEQLGESMHCAACDRWLRPALRFFYMERDLAPNLTAFCPCGYFVVAPPDASGKPARCKVCGQPLIMPQPAMKVDVPPVRTVKKTVLMEKMRQLQHQKKTRRKRKPRGPVEPAPDVGRITLRPGEAICVNLSCGALLPAKANVCPKCGTNRRTSRLYTGPGPEGDPVGKWKQV
jgi:hypothetical protein